MGIGDHIRQARKTRDLTAQQLGEQAGMSAKAVYRIETGEIKDPSISSIAGIAKALGIDIDELYYGERNDVLSIIRQVLAELDISNEEERDLLIEFVDTFKQRLWMAKEIKKLQDKQEALRVKMEVE